MPHSEPDKVEVKFAVHPDHTKTAQAALPLAGTPDEIYDVHFFELPPAGDPAKFPLLEQGLILRVRQVTSGGQDDATFKIRGEKAAAASATWGSLFPNISKLEGDQNVGGEVRNSFSITWEPPVVSLAPVLGGSEPLSKLYPSAVTTLLAEADFGWPELLAYGPIQARKWKVEVPGFPKKLTVEFWKTATKEILEISRKVDAAEAPAFAGALAKFMSETVQVLQLPGSKTEFALRNSPSFSLKAQA